MDQVAFDITEQGTTSSDEWEDLNPEEDDDASYEDDDLDQEKDRKNLSLGQEIRENWKQHGIAVLVAIFATLAAHVYGLTGSNGDKGPDADGLYMQYEPHEHLKGYARTSNITLCMNLDVKPTERLGVMDFHLSKPFVESLKLHFYADAWEDVHYVRVFDELGADQNFPHHDEIACIDHQTQSSKNYIKGLTHYYKEPSIASMYPDYDPQKETIMTATGVKEKPLQPAVLTFTGFGAKFFNLSPNPVLLFWDGRDERRLVGEIPPFESLGTATTPGQAFSVTPVYDADHAMERWVATADEVCLYFDPMKPEEIDRLTAKEVALYQLQKLNQEFGQEYLIHARRAWLGHFPRPFPLHPMWDASFIGQKQSFFDQVQSKTMDLTVESVTPRVFTIQDFLSAEECDILIELGRKEGLQASTVYAGSRAQQTRETTVRSSSNTWLQRGNATSLTDTIYRRAARLLKMDEALFQKPVDDDVRAHYHSIAESLQVVRYSEGEEYAAHHDFVYPSQQLWYQPTRYATLLFYLNDDFEGGHTVFPRAVTSDRHDGVTIKPKKGTAVLFYSVLPDGNLDDKSQHASKPVESGEKFIANLWIWEPLIN